VEALSLKALSEMVKEAANVIVEILSRSAGYRFYLRLESARFAPLGGELEMCGGHAGFQLGGL
jgi:hypothetical protein